MNIRCFKMVCVCITLVFIAIPAVAQSGSEDPQNEKTFLTFKRKPLVTYGIIAHTAFTTYLEYKWWWSGNYHDFAFQYEGFWDDYSLGVDKLGHPYTSYFYFSALREILMWGGYEEATSLWVSAAIASFYAISIEIGDGFSTYGFSPDDLAANFIGIGYALLQEKVPFFQNFNFKWSYYPSGIIPFDRYYRLTDDYDGHIYWLSMNMHNLLPKSLDGYWPRFLNLAIGYGGKNISGRSFPNVINPPGSPARKFAISLDFNLLSIPTTTDTWSTVKRIFNLFHIPAPGIIKIEGEPSEFKPLLLQ